MRNIKIGKRKICANGPIFIIAEAGVNHNGSVKLAKKMIDVALIAGADAIKFQTFKSEELVIPDVPCADYQRKNFPDISQLGMIRALELAESDFKKLSHYCKKKKIIFLSTPFDSQSVTFLNDLDVPAFKIGSGEITNIPLLRQVAKCGKPVILSTGMATLSEVKEAVRAIYSTGNKKLVLLHCTSNYPTAYQDVNLKAIETLKKEFKVPVGYSDHTLGIEVTIAAAAMGACIIEKHFTLDRNLRGPDHKASLEPYELRRMVESIRNVEDSIGNGIKKPAESETEIKKIARKSIVTRRDIPKGAMITPAMLAIKRPGTGIEPKFFDRLIGKRTKRSLKKDSLIKFGYLK